MDNTHGRKRQRRVIFILFFAVLCALANTALYGESATVTADSFDDAGRSSLMKAAEARDLALVESLIQQGADVNARNTKGFTAVSYVFASTELKNRVQTLDALVSAGASLNVNAVQSYFTSTPILFRACIENDADTLEYVLAHGIDADIADEEGANAWLWAAMLSYARDNEEPDASARRIRIFRALATANVSYEACLLSGYSPVSQAVFSQSGSEFTAYDVLDVLLEYHLNALPRQDHVTLDDLGKNLFTLVSHGVSPANRERFNHVLRICLDAGLSFNVRNDDGVPLLHFLCGNTDDAEAVGMLLDAGADPFYSDPEVEYSHAAYPLAIAVKSGNAAIVHELLEAGADPSFCFPGDDSQSLFDRAIDDGYAGIALDLLRHGAVPSGSYGPFPYGDRYGNALYAVLRNAYSDVVRDGKGAFDRDDSDLVKALLEAGVPADGGSDPESTALYYAQYHRNDFPPEILVLLRDSVEKDRRDMLISLANDARSTEFRENVGEVAESAGIPLLLMMSLIGGSVICREFTFANSPQSNGMATVNASITGAMAGFLAAGCIGFLADKEFYSHQGGSGAMVIALPVFTCLFGLAGGCVGAFLPANPAARQAFQENRFLYYIPSVAALAAGTALVFTIWLD